jgi:anti-sigma regulatory factor (Ser/Thr protein kinase)
MLMASVTTVIISDLVLNYVFVSVLHMRMFGIGIASSLSCFLAVLVCLGYFFSRDCPFHFSFRGISREKAADIISNGSPIILSQVLYVLRVYCFNLILLSLAGNDAVAAFSVVNSIANLLYCIGLGASGVMLMLSSLLYNENDINQLRDFLSDFIRYTLTIAAASVVIIELASPYITSLFFSCGSGTYGMALVGIRLFSVALIPACINALFKNYFQGIGHIQLNYLISFLESLALNVPLAWFFGRLFGFAGVCFGYLLAHLLTFVVISVIVWKKYGKVSFSAEAYCYLDRDFGLSPDDYKDFAVYNTEDAMAASDGAARFMKEKGMDSRLCFVTALCVEEVCMNTVKYGFGDDSVEHHAEVRVIVSGDQHIVRFRDDCLAFDPTKYLELHNDNDPTSHLGIRTMMAFSKEVIYINSLGLNNLTLIM